MILTILGLIAIVVFARQVYKEANGTGRNAVLWTIITCLIGVGIQLVLPFMVGLIYVAVLLAGGTAPQAVSMGFGFSFLLTVLPLVLSLVGMFLVMKHVSTLLEDPVTVAGPTPPPPPTF